MPQAAQEDPTFFDDDNDEDLFSIFVSDAEVAEAQEAVRTGRADMADIAGFSDEEVEALYARGLELLRIGLYQQAAREFFRLVRLRRTNARFIRGLGLAYHYQRMFRWARTIYGQALVYDPRDVISKVLRAECTLLMVGKVEAVKELREALAMLPRGHHDMPYVKRAEALFAKLAVYQGVK